MGDHYRAQHEHQHADADGEFVPVRSQRLGPVVDHSSHKGLHDAKLAVDAQNLHKITNYNYKKIQHSAIIWHIYDKLRDIKAL